MRVMIIDNGSKHVPEIVAAFAGIHQTEIHTYTPEKPIVDEGYDLIVLSGGMTNEVSDDYGSPNAWYRTEFQLIRNTKTPILAICLGLQMCVVALGGKLKKLPEFVNEPGLVRLNELGDEVLGIEPFMAYEAHSWVASDIDSTGFEVLASGPWGIELMLHRERHIIATQFHPEVMLENQNPATIIKALTDSIA